MKRIEEKIYPVKSAKRSPDKPGLFNRVNKILADVRPSLQTDGGDVELKSVKDGVVELKIKGACQGCPMAYLTFGSGIGQRLKEKIPEIRAVKY